MSGLPSKALREIAKDVKKHGWTVEMTKKSHVCFVSPDGRRVTAGGTLSDHRAVKNIYANLRQAGLPRS